MKKISLIILMFFLLGCGYTAVYKDRNFQNIQINVSNLSGNRDFNNLLLMELAKFMNSSGDELYILEVNTEYNKIDYAKDATGKASEFELNLLVTFNVEHDGIKKTISLNERFYTNVSENKFKQKNYENIIMKNFATSIKDQLIFRLSTF